MGEQHPIIKQPSQKTSDWIRWFFARTSIHRMSQEKINRILEDHKSKQQLKNKTG